MSAAAVQTERLPGVRMALQPIVDLASGRVVGVESLARFADLRSPDAHFAEADSEGNRLQLELDAVSAGLARLDELPADAYLTVNISPETAVTSDLALVLHDAPADRIILELTEHAPVVDYAALCGALAGLRARGFRVAIDDAGAGFASMRHVLALHPDVIKLDISITRGIDADTQRRELVRALVQFTRATGCTLVAEGIETRAELEEVRALGVGCGQGFWLGRPAQGKAGPWRVALPSSPRRMFPRPKVRVSRPASVLIAAALLWPSLIAAAGLKTPSAGGYLPKAPATELSADVGGSAQAPAKASEPAAALPSIPTVRTEHVATQPKTAEPTPPPKRPGVVEATGNTAGSVVGGIDHTAGITIDSVERTLGRLLGGTRGG